MDYGFNTSHVTLYREDHKYSLKTLFVSIHLMLLFISMQILRQDLHVGFNTSHVTLYPSTLQHFSHLTFL